MIPAAFHIHSHTSIHPSSYQSVIIITIGTKCLVGKKWVQMGKMAIWKFGLHFAFIGFGLAKKVRRRILHITIKKSLNNLFPM
jgi:hypothetical protein